MSALRHSPLLDSVANALRGIGFGLLTQRNLRIHAVLGTLALAAGLLLRLGATKMAVLVLAIAAVMAAELANTAVEASVDVATPDIHPLAGVAKDVAAGAVLLTAAAAVVVGLLLFLPPLLERLGALR